MRRHTNPWKTECRPGAGLAAGKRQVPGGDNVLPGWIPPPRRKGDAHPGRISMARNIAIPSGVRRLATCGNPTARKGQAPSGDRSAQEAKAGSPRQGAPPRLRLRRVERHREDGTDTASSSGGAARVATACGARDDREPDTGPGGPARKGADVSMVGLRMISRCGTCERKETLGAMNSTAVTGPVMVNGTDDAALGWDAINWRKAERDVTRLRRRIFAAEQAGSSKKVASLQRLMLRSRANTLVACGASPSRTLAARRQG